MEPDNPASNAHPQHVETVVTKPKNSEHMALEESFDYKKTALAPSGTNLVVYKTLGKRASWEDRGVEGCNLDREWIIIAIIPSM